MQITPELILLRTALASPSLRPGAIVSARVLDRGVLSLLGARVPATLPDDVRPGDVLRLNVKEAGPDRILLQVVQQPPPVAMGGGCWTTWSRMRSGVASFTCSFRTSPGRTSSGSFAATRAPSSESVARSITRAATTAPGRSAGDARAVRSRMSSGVISIQVR